MSNRSTAESTGARLLAETVKLAGPTGLVVGIAYYFGYVSTKAFYSYFGINLHVLDFPVSYYLVRAVETLFRGALSLILVLLAVFVIHHILVHVLGRDPRRALEALILVLGTAMVLVGVALFGLYRSSTSVVSPLALIAGAVLLEYGLWLATRFTRPPRWILVGSATGSGIRRGLIAALVLVGIFWGVTVLAVNRGFALARAIEVALCAQPQAVVYSEKDLQLPGPLVGVTRMDTPDTAYHFRYNGLRPLVYSRDRWFLLPVGWSHDNGATALVLLDDPGHVRVDLAPGSLESCPGAG